MPDSTGSKLAFWIHQLVEYLMGAFLLVQAVQAEEPAVPLVAAAVLLLLAATADGPLAAAHLVPRRVHRVLDLVAAAAFVAAALLLDPGVTGRLIVGVGALVLIALVVRTNYSPRAPRPSRPSGSRGDRAEEFGRSAGRLVAKQVQARKRRGAGSAPPSGGTPSAD